MLRLEMLPALYGDALWLEYGDESSPRVVIIDCGFKDNYPDLKDRINRLRPGQLELLVLTHVDDDHIKGAIPLIADTNVRLPPEMDVWFNGWQHLNPSDELSAEQGEMFAALIRKRGLRWNALEPWNKSTIVVPDDGPLPSGTLSGGLEWTLLSPSWSKVRDMRDLWKKKIEARDRTPGDAEQFLDLFADRPELQPDELSTAVPSVEELLEDSFVEDNKEPNGSSIALLVEFGGKSLLLAGDAHPSVLTQSLRRLAQRRCVERVAVDALKVSHHGSKKNTSPELLEAIKCKTFLFSSNGRKHGHPSPECVARIIKQFPECTLHFNYDSNVNARWAQRGDQAYYRFKALYPSDAGCVLQL